MARITIKSRLHGDVDFFMPDNGGYVRIENGRNHGTLGSQICYGGGLRGNTITANLETFEREVRRWWKQRLAADRNL